MEIILFVKTKRKEINKAQNTNIKRPESNMRFGIKAHG